MTQLLRRLAAALLFFVSLSASGSAIWLTDASDVYAIDTLANRATTIARSAPISALASTPEGSAWVLFEQDLVLLEPQGAVRSQIDLARLGVQAPRYLLADAHNGTLWLT